jgi:hypothetical protein
MELNTLLELLLLAVIAHSLLMFRTRLVVGAVSFVGCRTCIPCWVLHV